MKRSLGADFHALDGCESYYQEMPEMRGTHQWVCFVLQDDNAIAKREKSRLKEMERSKKQKLQEILDTQNAAIEADMVCFLKENYHLTSELVLNSNFNVSSPFFYRGRIAREKVV